MDLFFYPLDYEYKVQEGRVLVFIYGKTKENEKVCVIIEHQPFFYADAEGVDKNRLIQQLQTIRVEEQGREGKITHWEETDKELVGKKKKFYKIYTTFPKAVPLIAKQLEKLGVPTYEKDILFIHRFLRDLNLIPTALIKAEGEYKNNPSLRIPAFHADRLEQATKESIKKVRILSLDIETYAKNREIEPQKNPILMIAFSGVDESGREFRKVITWKTFPHTLDYLETVHDEAALLQRFKEILLDFDPDIIAGYFTDGFDFPYIKARAEKLKVRLDVGIDYSELKTSSKASLRDGETKITGIVHLDVFKFIRNIFGRNLKTDSFGLDAVSQELLGHQKHNVNLDDLAPAWDNHPDKLEEFCKYNLHDADLTRKLCEKLLSDMFEFSKIVGLPVFDVIRMRFSRLVESYIMKRAMEFNVIAPNKPNDYELGKRMEESIQGGFVYEPIPGLYNDLVVFDFRSLYPTIITAHNIGPESFRCACCKDKEHVPGKEEYWFCQREKKFIPQVLEELILRRMEIKKKLKETQKLGDDTTFLEARSYALKLLANSFYGYLGFYGARWYCLECAASTTAYARNYIKQTISKAEEKGFKVLYGDSLTPERRIFVMNEKEEISLVPIGTFVDQNLNNDSIDKYKTLAFDGKKLIFSPIKRTIRHHYDSKSKGEILSFVTTYGCTRVTPQHSLYQYRNGKEELVHASALQVGDLLVSLTGSPVYEIYNENHLLDLAEFSFGAMEHEIYFYKDNFKFPAKRGICPYCQKEVHLSSHAYTHHNDRKINKRKTISEEFSWVGTSHAEGGRIPRYWKLTSELAWILGFYCAEGSASDCMTKSGSRKCMISFGSQDLSVIERVKKYFDNILNDSLKIITSYDKRINKYMYYYRIQRIPLVGLFVYGFGCGKKSKGKMVPSFIYSSEEKIRKSFVDGYLTGDGNSKKDKRYQTHFIRCDTNSKDLACGLDYLFKSLHHGTTFYGKEIKHIGWRYRKDKPLVSSLRVQSGKNCQGDLVAARIKEIKKESYEGFVYDLEVSQYHNFVDAEGLLLVHNTDSCFFQLREGKTILDAQEFMHEINKDLPGHMELEFEGYFPKGIFVSQKGKEAGAKKRYALLSDKGTIKITGFEVVRRNVSVLAKEVQKNVLQLVLQDKVEEAVTYVRKTVQEIKKGNMPKEKLILKTQITRELDTYASIGPHVAVAQSMKEKGHPIVPGTVVEYIITKGNGLTRERAKMVEEAHDYDADYYINNQILPAVSSIFAVLGYSEEDIAKESSQKGLGDFFR